MAWTNAKTAAAVGIGLLVVAGTATVAVKGTEEFRTPEWQKKYDPTFLDRLPPQVKILPSLSSTLNDGVHVSGNRNGKIIALGQSVPDLVIMAYDIHPAQLVWKAPVIGGKYDLFANFPKDNEKAAQQVIAKKLGLTVRYETIQTNAFVMSVESSNAPGFRPAGKVFSGNWAVNSYSAHGQGTKGLIDYIENYLGTLIIDDTKLTNSYDIDFQWDGRTREGLRRALLEQAGLELTPTNQPIQMLVVEKIQ